MAIEPFKAEDKDTTFFRVDYGLHGLIRPFEIIRARKRCREFHIDLEICGNMPSDELKDVAELRLFATVTDFFDSIV